MNLCDYDYEYETLALDLSDHPAISDNVSLSNSLAWGMGQLQ